MISISRTYGRTLHPLGRGDQPLWALIFAYRPYHPPQLLSNRVRVLGTSGTYSLPSILPHLKYTESPRHFTHKIPAFSLTDTQTLLQSHTVTIQRC